ncbi:MAG: nitrilase family protein [Prevotella sp.]|nr:nitrilase family protein [Prevotella sp.]
MKTTLLQTDICWAQPDDNIRRARQLLADHPGSDLYVLPEMWSTGFATEPAGIAADESGNAALEWMQAEARERRCAVCGSLAVRLADGTYRNRHYFVDGRTDSVSYYDKHHLFTHGHEDRYYTPGTEPCIVSYDGFRLLLLTCYDLRFPVWSRYAEGHAYDAIVVVANWPDTRQAAWQVLTRARAVENQCFLVGVNRVGDDRYSHYAGASCVVDCYGKCLGQCRRNGEQALTVDLDLAELNRRRGKFRVLEDGDNFRIIL